MIRIARHPAPLRRLFAAGRVRTVTLALPGTLGIVESRWRVRSTRIGGGTSILTYTPARPPLTRSAGASMTEIDYLRVARLLATQLIRHAYDPRGVVRHLEMCADAMPIEGGTYRAAAKLVDEAARGTGHTTHQRNG